MMTDNKYQVGDHVEFQCMNSVTREVSTTCAVVLSVTPLYYVGDYIYEIEHSGGTMFIQEDKLLGKFD